MLMDKLRADFLAARKARQDVRIALLTALVGEAAMIGKNNGNITNMKITNRTPEFFDILVDVEVQDVRHLTNIIAALRANPAINSVDRTKGR